MKKKRLIKWGVLLIALLLYYLYFFTPGFVIKDIYQISPGNSDVSIVKMSKAGMWFGETAHLGTYLLEEVQVEMLLELLKGTYYTRMINNISWNHADPMTDYIIYVKNGPDIEEWTYIHCYNGDFIRFPNQIGVSEYRIHRPSGEKWIECMEEILTKTPSGNIL